MDYKNIGAFIADMRKEQGLTQRELADRLGISDKTVSKWERGNGLPEVSLMLPLCSALHINLNELFSGERLTDANYQSKAEETIIRLVGEAENMKKNIVGGQALGQAKNIDYGAESIHTINNAFWSTIGSDALGVTALPSYGGFITEDKLHLLGDLTGKTILEIGCGSGESLQYVHRQGAAELWGMDISAEQLTRAQTLLSAEDIEATLICSPMEDECAVPIGYFDVVFSVFGIGWTTNLNSTFKRIYSYLKPNGIFVFNWSHPMHKCTTIEENALVVSHSYFDEHPYSATIGHSEIILANRTLSTYINALSENDFVIERLIERGDEDLLKTDDSPFGNKAKRIPVSFVVKARK